MTAFDDASMLLGYVWEAACLLLVTSIAAAGVSGWLADRRRRRADVERALRCIPPDNWVHVADAVQRPLLSERVKSWTALDDAQFRRAVDGGR